MPDINPHNPTEYQLRAKLPQYVRLVAIASLAVTVIIVAAGFYRERSRSSFRLKSEHAQLSTEVVAEVNNYERAESDNGIAKFYIKADHAKTFSDDHQELTNVYLEVYDREGVASDKMTSQQALYVPEKDKNFTAYLKGDVKITTRDELNVNTEHITYTRNVETAEADEAVHFERGTLRGRSIGATVKIADKRLDLLQDVELELFESPELAKANVRYARINAGRASYDQTANNVELNQNVSFNIDSKAKPSGAAQTTSVNADRALFTLTGDPKSAQLASFELFENVHIVTADMASSTNLDAGYALYEKVADRYTLKNGSHIVSTAKETSTDLRSSEAVFEQTAKQAALTGSAEITQAGGYLKGDSITAQLFPDNKVKEAVSRGNTLARQSSPIRTTTISAPELNASFNDARQLQNANAAGQSTVEIVPVENKEYSSVIATAVVGIGINFKGEGLIEMMQTNGRTTIQLNAPNNGPGAANKRVTADAVTTLFAANGKDIKRAEAVGNAELFVEPINAGKDNYRTTVNAPRFDCEFFATGNNARSCVGGKKAKAVRVPTIASEGRGEQNLSADQLTAQFNQASNDVERFDAAGSAKFVELDRSAVAREMSFTQADQTVRLRGGEPTVWDSRARAKAREIDWDTKNNRSVLRGGVSTTYYSQKQMRGSAPFGSSNKPVFMTAENAEIDHAAETATYTQNARGWQDDNYVRGDKIFVDQKGGRFIAEGHVQSLLYNAKHSGSGKQGVVPTSASAAVMTFVRDSRVLQYRNNVDIRQGTDRITAASADIYLTETNEMGKTVAETDVVITQPGRRATGTWAQYTSADEIAILRGNPASVTDAENGSSQSEQITVHMRDNRIVGESKTKQNTTGRSRSVYKVKSN